jgi:hypothetical protein
VSDGSRKERRGVTANHSIDPRRNDAPKQLVSLGDDANLARLIPVALYTGSLFVEPIFTCPFGRGLPWMPRGISD